PPHPCRTGVRSHSGNIRRPTDRNKRVVSSFADALTTAPYPRLAPLAGGTFPQPAVGGTCPDTWLGSATPAMYRLGRVRRGRHQTKSQDPVWRPRLHDRRPEHPLPLRVDGLVPPGHRRDL